MEGFRRFWKIIEGYGILWKVIECCEKLYPDNQVANTLSCYFEYNTIVGKHPDRDFIKAEEILDPDGDLIPIKRFTEI